MPSLQRLRRLVRPNSIGAYMFAGVCVLVGTTLRVVIGWIDVGAAPFTVYFPIILIIALLCGVAVSFVALALILLVGWWAFIPPYYEFAELTPRALLNLSLFAFASSITIWLADAYRRAVDALRIEENGSCSSTS
jgi:K+-sensing histidine kinase KdpD